MRQPRISGRTLRQCNIAEISLHNQAQRATNGLHGHKDMKNYQAQVWHGTEFNWQQKTTKATAWSGSIPQASGWATDPSTLLLHIFAMVEDESSQRLAT